MQVTLTIVDPITQNLQSLPCTISKQGAWWVCSDGNGYTRGMERSKNALIADLNARGWTVTVV